MLNVTESAQLCSAGVSEMQVILQNDSEIELWRDGVETRMLVSSLTVRLSFASLSSGSSPGMVHRLMCMPLKKC